MDPYIVVQMKRKAKEKSRWEKWITIYSTHINFNKEGQQRVHCNFKEIEKKV